MNTHPIIRLIQRSPSSYMTANIPALADWLAHQHYLPEPVRSRVEYARLRRHRSLIVLYHSGSVVVQGLDVAVTQRLLAQLVTDGVQEVLL